MEKTTMTTVQPQKWVYAYLIPWIVPVLLILFWQWAVDNGHIAARILPAPLDIAETAERQWEAGKLQNDIQASAQRAFSGLLVGGGIGFVLGLLNGLFPISEKLLDSTVQMIRAIPNLALVPLVILWFGIEEDARLFLISSGVFFPIYLNTFHGIRHVDKGLIEMGRSYGLSQWALFWHVILPGALPSILVGLRFSLGIMWLTLIIAETIAVDAGIGHMIVRAREFSQTNIMVLAILIYALLGKSADVVVRFLERVLLSWHPNYSRGEA
jgi:sulfonate transport system permease protein